MSKKKIINKKGWVLPQKNASAKEGASAEYTEWRLTAQLPINKVQWNAVREILRALDNNKEAVWNYLVVDFQHKLGKACYIQAGMTDDSGYLVELHFEKKKRMKQFRQFESNLESVENIFRQVLCEAAIPDMSIWDDCTAEIFL